MSFGNHLLKVEELHCCSYETMRRPAGRNQRVAGGCEGFSGTLRVFGLFKKSLRDRLSSAAVKWKVAAAASAVQPDWVFGRAGYRSGVRVNGGAASDERYLTFNRKTFPSPEPRSSPAARRAAALRRVYNSLQTLAPSFDAAPPLVCLCLEKRCKRRLTVCRRAGERGRNMEGDLKSCQLQKHEPSELPETLTHNGADRRRKLLTGPLLPSRTAGQLKSCTCPYIPQSGTMH